MAVVQISRIQVRRGQKNQGSGLPQLASGELGWAVDTRELYIGNGSVSEGAPAVGNTKVLTEYDDLFDLADTYTYKENDSYIITGPDESSPIQRTLQDRLDDRVSLKSFGASGVESQDATAEIQRALDYLYLNDTTKGTPASRVTLYIDPGIYTVSDTIYIPPNATIIGAGAEKTIIKSAQTDKPVFQTINDSSEPGTPASDSTSSFINQARNITMQGITIENTNTNKALVLQSCRDSVFEDIRIKGTWNDDVSSDPIVADTTATNDIGILLASLSSSVASNGNMFRRIYIENYAYGVVTNDDIQNNNFYECTFSNLGIGFAFCKDAAPGTTGPSNTMIEKSLFDTIYRQAIQIDFGSYNKSSNNRFVGVGNDAGIEGSPVYSCVKFGELGNTSESDYFSRTAVLAYNQFYINSIEYIPEVEGPVNWTWGFEHEVTINRSESPFTIFRLPQGVNQAFDIDYTLESQSYNLVRTGTITVVVNDDCETSDEYHYNGDELYLDNIIFDAILVDRSDPVDAINETVEFRAISLMPAEDQTVMKFRVRTKQPS